MTQGELEQIPLPFQKYMRDLEYRIMSDLVGRLKANFEITSTADWQINRLQQLSQSNTYIKEQIQKALELSRQDIDWLFSDAVKQEYVRNRDIYEKAGEVYVEFEKNKELQEFLRAVKTQTNDELKNMTQSLGFAIRGEDGKINPSSVMEFYQTTLDNAIMELSTGSFSYDEVLKRTIQLMTASGLRTVDYDSGWSNRVDVAARKAVMTGFNQIQAKINEQVAKDLHTNFFEVSWHAGARPTHQLWQGRVYPYEELVSICGLGEVTGLLGANCYHQYNAFIPGISVRTYSDEQLERMNEEENRKKEYDGKEYTTYEALQKQRQMETLMRKQRQDIKLLEDGQGNESDIRAAKSRYRSTMAQYVDFSDKMELPQQKERIYADGLNISSKKVQNSGDANAEGILKETTDRWSAMARRELLQDERALAVRKKETAVIYSPDGKFLFQKRGNEKEVSFTKREVEKMKGCVVSHNHPTGGSFSAEDINLLRMSNAAEIRAATENGVYFLRSSGKWPVDIDSKEKIKLARDEIIVEVRKKYGKLYREGKISAVERFRMASDELNRRFAERYGLVYGKESFED